jgi:ATP-dependent RNA helicase DeaD
MQRHSELARGFAELGVKLPFLKAVGEMGFREPTEIQRAVVPTALQGKDILGQARTGTGKTAAFGLPTMQRIDPADGLQALCLAPTRELATQVVGELRRLSAGADLHIVPVYGGQKIRRQIHLLGRRTHFVVGTPGRVLDLLRRQVLKFDDVSVCILDEVDRMLDIGFREDITKILGRIKHEHQTIFVSATIDEDIKRLAQRFMNEPIEVNVSRDKLTVEEVDQAYCSVEPHDKYRLLRTLLKEEQPESAIVFCNTKHGARKLAKKLHADGINAKEIHGDLIQERRERVMARFRNHKVKLLIATDLAARGLDISAVTHIINYDIPEDPEVYVHRIGRTARMGATGRAITFVTPEQGKQITEVEKLINKIVEERRYEGFVPRPKREERPAEPEEPAPMSRYAAPVSDVDEDERPAKTPPKTLGSKFRPIRRRRR